MATVEAENSALRQQVQKVSSELEKQAAARPTDQPDVSTAALRDEAAALRRHLDAAVAELRGELEVQAAATSSLRQAVGDAANAPAAVAAGQQMSEEEVGQLEGIFSQHDDTFRAELGAAVEALNGELAAQAAATAALWQESAALRAELVGIGAVAAPVETIASELSLKEVGQLEGIFAEHDEAFRADLGTAVAALDGRLEAQAAATAALRQDSAACMDEMVALREARPTGGGHLPADTL